MEIGRRECLEALTMLSRIFSLTKDKVWEHFRGIWLERLLHANGCPGSCTQTRMSFNYLLKSYPIEQ